MNDFLNSIRFKLLIARLKSHAEKGRATYPYSKTAACHGGNCFYAGTPCPSIQGNRTAIFNTQQGAPQDFAVCFARL